MKNFACFLLAFSLLILGCKKDNTPIADDPSVMELTFTGTVTDAITQSPVANVPVNMVYGTMCCGGIEVIKGSDSTKTDSRGMYTIKVKYNKGDAAYRHIVYVPGYSAKRVNLPTALQRNSFWLTVEYDDAAVLPIALADTVKIVKGLVSTANFKILPSSIVRLHFPYTTVPPTDSLDIGASVSLAGITSPYADNMNLPRQFRPNYELNISPFFLELPTLANKKVVITTSVYQAGSGTLKETVVDSVTLVQGQIYEYNVQY